MQPAYIHDIADFQRSVHIGHTVESLFLEFKNRVNWHIPDGTVNGDQERRKIAKEFARDVAQFANGLGGCLLIGIDERERGPGQPFKIAAGITGVPDPQGFVQWAEAAIRNFLVPYTFEHGASHIDSKGQIVVALNVPPSRHLIALWDHQPHTIEYLYRTNHGKDWMNPDEMERNLMSGGSRFGKISLNAVAKAGDDVDLASGLWRHAGGSNLPFLGHGVQIGTLLEQVFELKVAWNEGTVLSVPYSLVREAWSISPNRVGLLLGARVVLVDKHFVLEPV